MKHNTHKTSHRMVSLHCPMELLEVFIYFLLVFCACDLRKLNGFIVRIW